MLTRHKPGDLETLIIMIKMRMRLAGHQVPSTTGDLVMVKMRMLGTKVARVEKQNTLFTTTQTNNITGGQAKETDRRQCEGWTRC